jgi:hypothetical protein
MPHDQFWRQLLWFWLVGQWLGGFGDRGARACKFTLTRPGADVCARCGGRCYLTDWRGQELTLSTAPTLAAANADLHQLALAVLQDVTADAATSARMPEGALRAAGWLNPAPAAADVGYSGTPPPPRRNMALPYMANQNIPPISNILTM